MQSYVIVFAKIANHGFGRDCDSCPWCDPRPEDIKEWDNAAKVFEYAKRQPDYSVYRERARRLGRDIHTGTVYKPWQDL